MSRYENKAIYNIKKLIRKKFSCKEAQDDIYSFYNRTRKRKR